MNSLVPINDRKAHAAIEAAINALPDRLPAGAGGQYVAPGDALKWGKGATFSALSGRWTCQARRALMRFEQVDWSNSVLSIAGKPAPFSLKVTVQEDVFEVVLAGLRLRGRDAATDLRFRINDGPMRSLRADIQVDAGCVVIGGDEAVALARYMTTGKRLAVELSHPGEVHHGGVFDITGFEYANFDALRRFVFI